jgi:hypothetical protein
MGQYDKTKPAGSTKFRLSDEEIRDNWDALEDAIGQNHKFPTGYGTDAGEHTQIVFNAVLGADPDPGTGKFAIYPKDNAAADPDLFCQDENDTVLKVFYGEGGTEMLFVQNSAPTGWTRNTARQDNAMLCHAATGDIATGGSVNPQSTHTHTGPAHTHAGPSHAHAGSSHTHSYGTLSGYATLVDASGPGAWPAGGTLYANTSLYPAVTLNAGATGSGGTGNTGAGGTGATSSGGTGATGANTAPYFLETISCLRDV